MQIYAEEREEVLSQQIYPKYSYSHAFFRIPFPTLKESCYEKSIYRCVCRASISGPCGR